MSQHNKAIIDKVNAAFTRNDIEGVLAFCADDFEWTMVGDKPVKGKDAIRQWMASAPPEPPKFTVKTTVAEGDVVMAMGDMTMPENGVAVPYSFCDVWRFKGEKLVELKAFVIKTSRAAA